MIELELDERSELEEGSELLLELDGSTRIDDALELATDDRLDGVELGAELLVGVAVAI